MGVFFTRNSSFRNSSLVNFRLGILEFPLEILGSSWGMTQKAKLGDDRKFRIPKDKFRIHRDCSLFFSKPRNDAGNSKRLLRFARNDGISAMTRIP